MKILHVLRAPVGGLFRHVADLARAQTARGHRVAVLCDSEANDRLTEQRLADLSPTLALGLHRIAMARDLDWRDVTATRSTVRLAAILGADVLHGHGAKGGAYARLAAQQLKRRGRRVVALYTPHGGSLHFAPTTIKGRIFMALERTLARSTDGIVFESAYSARVYADNVGLTGPLKTRIIPNGIDAAELQTVQPKTDAADFLFVGELRHLKGVDLLLEALAAIETPRRPSAVIVGDGPDAGTFKALAARLGLARHVSFPGAMPARQAFALGRSLVMPSRAESFPYIVLEAGGAGVPMIATAVGGIPETAEGSSRRLVPPADSSALAAAMTRHLNAPDDIRRDAQSLREVIAGRYSVERMAEAVLAFYRDLAAEHTFASEPVRPLVDA